MSVRVGLAALALVLAAAGWADAAESVWDAVRQPGAVIVVRHSYAPGTFDPPDARLDDCSTQRNLDAAGRAQAQRLGEAFRRQGITVGAVLSSPRCRCLETGRLAFGRAESWLPLQGALRDAELRRRLTAEIQQRIAAHRDGPPLVLVTHGSVVTDLTGSTSGWGNSSCSGPAATPGTPWPAASTWSEQKLGGGARRIIALRRGA